MILNACKRRHRTAPDWHYYIQDYMGNVRMVVNSDGTVEQQNHYYPYGGIIGNQSTNQDLQTFKFESKELDRRYGLDWYDIQARQYDAIGVPAWNKPDPLAEKNPHLSPYAFAGGNPINNGDYNGMDWICRTVDDVQEIYWDPDVNDEDSYLSIYGNYKYKTIRFQEGHTENFNGIEYIFSNKNSNVTSTNDWDASKILDLGDNIIFGNASNACDARTLHKNLFGTSYTGTTNPKDYSSKDNYDYVPRNPSEKYSKIHDIMYDLAQSNSKLPAFFDCSEAITNADLILVMGNLSNLSNPKASLVDKARSLGTAILFTSLFNIKYSYRETKKALKQMF